MTFLVERLVELRRHARNYDVSRDGQEFLMLKEGGDSSSALASTSSIVMVVNFAEGLKGQWH